MSGITNSDSSSAEAVRSESESYVTGASDDD